MPIFANGAMEYSFLLRKIPVIAINANPVYGTRSQRTSQEQEDQQEVKTFKVGAYEIMQKQKEYHGNLGASQRHKAELAQSLMQAEQKAELAYLSASRGGLSDEENRLRTQQLRKDLRHLNAKPRKARGFYEGNYERSNIVSTKALSKDQAIALAKKYDQDSIIYADELIDKEGNVLLTFKHGKSQFRKGKPGHSYVYGTRGLAITKG